MQALVVQLSTGIIVNVDKDVRVVFLPESVYSDKEKKENILEYATNEGLILSDVLIQWDDAITQLAQHREEE